MKKGFAFLVAGLFVGSVAVAACGSSDSSDGATTATTATTSTASNTTASTASGNGGSGGSTASTTATGSGGGKTGPMACLSIPLSPDPAPPACADGGTSDAGAEADCASCCETQYPNGYQRFGCYQLEECACAGSTSPCASACTTECADPTKLMGEDPTMAGTCASCLLGEAAKGTNSMCTVNTIFNDCSSADATCNPFGNCATVCVTGG